MRLIYIAVYISILIGGNVVTASGQSTIQKNIYSTGIIEYNQSFDQSNHSGPHLRGIAITWNQRHKVHGSGASAATPQDSWFQEGDVELIKSYGGNLIEIHAIRLGEIMPERGQINQDFFDQWVDVWVEWCTRHEVYIVLNVEGLHRPGGILTEWGPYSCPPWIREGYGLEDGWWSKSDALERQAEYVHDFFDHTVEAQEPNREAVVQMWQYIADRYSGNEYVLFAPFNEPMHHTWEYMTDESSQRLGVGYSRLMERIVDAIRSTGSMQTVFIDKPYLRGPDGWLGLDYVRPVSRPNVVWEVHQYIETWYPNLEEYRQKMDSYIQKFSLEFGQSVYIGEYGYWPPDWGKNNLPDWEGTLQDLVYYLDELPIMGRSFYCYTVLDGEYMDKYDYLTSEESQFILTTVLG